MVWQSAALFFACFCLYTCVAGKRNLEKELDALKLSFDKMKISHQNEIDALKKVIYNQGQENKQLKKDHDSDIKKLREDIDSFLSFYREWSKAVPVEVKKMVRTYVGAAEGSDAFPDQRKKIRRNAFKSDSVPFLPFKRNIGDENVQVAFYAYLSHDVINLGANQIIEFDHVITNKGNLYNNTTGIFYCDMPGIYVFSVHILVNPRKVAYTVLTQNKKPVAYIHAQSVDSTYSHGSNTAILQLRQGDSISVRAHSNYSSTGNVIDEQWSSFSGFLLYEEELVPAVIG